MTDPEWDDREALQTALRAFAPPPDPAARTTARQAVLAAFDMQALPTPRRAPGRLAWAWAIVRFQARLVHGAVWLGSALIIALGGLVTLAYTLPGSGLAPLALLAPLAAALGAAFLYGDEADPPLELQLAAPAPRAAVLLARLALLFGFNLAAALGMSVALAALSPELALWPLITSWLAPMTVLSALAFLSSVALGDSGLSALIGFLLWGGLVLSHLDPVAGLPDLWRLGLLPAAGLGAAAAALAVWLAGRDTRWARGAS